MVRWRSALEKQVKAVKYRLSDDIKKVFKERWGDEWDKDKGEGSAYQYWLAQKKLEDNAMKQRGK